MWRHSWIARWAELTDWNIFLIQLNFLKVTTWSFDPFLESSCRYHFITRVKLVVISRIQATRKPAPTDPSRRRMVDGPARLLASWRLTEQRWCNSEASLCGGAIWATVLEFRGYLLTRTLLAPSDTSETLNLHFKFASCSGLLNFAAQKANKREGGRERRRSIVVLINRKLLDFLRKILFQSVCCATLRSTT